MKVHASLCLRYIMRVTSNHWRAELKDEYLQAQRNTTTMSPAEYVHLCLSNKHMRNARAHVISSPATHTTSPSGQVIPVAKASISAIDMQPSARHNEAATTSAPAPMPKKHKQPEPERPPKSPTKVDKRKRLTERRVVDDLALAINAINTGDQAGRYPRTRNSNIKRGVCWNCREENHQLYECKAKVNFDNLREARDSYKLDTRLQRCVPVTQAMYDKGKLRWKEIQARRDKGHSGRSAYTSE
jgi:hypothetical protein